MRHHRDICGLSLGVDSNSEWHQSAELWARRLSRPFGSSFAPRRAIKYKLKWDKSAEDSFRWCRLWPRAGKLEISCSFGLCLHERGLVATSAGAHSTDEGHRLARRSENLPGFDIGRGGKERRHLFGTFAATADDDDDECFFDSNSLEESKNIGKEKHLGSPLCECVRGTNDCDNVG